MKGEPKALTEYKSRMAAKESRAMISHWYDQIGPSQITDQIWVSGYKAAADLWNANPAGITHVLNVSTNPPYLQAEKITYMDCPFEDGEAIPPEKFEAAMAFMEFACEAGGKILVHCAAGISRSVTIVCSYLHRSGQMEFSAALNYVYSKRRVADPAISVLNSARKLLGAWPYDGTYAKEPDEKKLIEEVIQSLLTRKTTIIHPDPTSQSE